MSGLVAFFNQITPILQSILILAALVGGVFVVRNTKRNGIVQIQSDTIEAMQHQLDALKEQNTQQQEKIDHLEDELKTMREALEDEGIFIVVDGKKVTIKNAKEPDITKHIIRKPTRKPMETPKKDEA
jgi:hypothetical protein